MATSLDELVISGTHIKLLSRQSVRADHHRYIWHFVQKGCAERTSTSFFAASFTSVSHISKSRIYCVFFNRGHAALPPVTAHRHAMACTYSACEVRQPAPSLGSETPSATMCRSQSLIKDCCICRVCPVSLTSSPLLCGSRYEEDMSVSAQPSSCCPKGSCKPHERKFQSSQCAPRIIIDLIAISHLTRCQTPSLALPWICVACSV